VSRDRAGAGDCLRALAAEALLYAEAGHDLLPLSLGLMAAGNAFVMLGLLPEERAEAIMADQRAALEDKGLGRYWGVSEGEPATAAWLRGAAGLPRP
jgi:hypothetical protein